MTQASKRLKKEVKMP